MSSNIVRKPTSETLDLYRGLRYSSASKDNGLLSNAKAFEQAFEQVFGRVNTDLTDFGSNGGSRTRTGGSGGSSDIQVNANPSGHRSSGNEISLGTIPEGSSVISTLSFSNNDDDTSKSEITKSIEAQGGRVLAFEEGEEGVGDIAAVVVAWGPEASNRDIEIEGIYDGESSLSVQFSTVNFDATDPSVRVSTTDVRASEKEDVSHTTRGSSDQLTMAVAVHDDNARVTRGYGQSSEDDALAVSLGLGSQTAALSSTEGKRDDTLTFGLTFTLPSTGTAAQRTTAPPPAPQSPPVDVELPSPSPETVGRITPVSPEERNERDLLQHLSVMLTTLGFADDVEMLKLLLPSFGINDLDIDLSTMIDDSFLFDEAEKYITENGTTFDSFMYAEEKFMSILLNPNAEVPKLW